jgi:hypothetical protein
VYDNLSAAVRKIIEGQHQLTKRFAALVSHYLFESCFARVGEGHDRGGVESRGKAIRLQHLAPVPRGDNLSAIAQNLVTELEQAFTERSNLEGRRLSELWDEERPQLMALPPTPFEVSEPVTVEISSRALVRVEGAWYSTPSHWARLHATAYIGVEQIRLACMDESVIHPRVGFGRRRVVYRHYLPELARKPQAHAPGRTRVARRTGRTVERIVAIARRGPWSTRSRPGLSQTARRTGKTWRSPRAAGARGGAGAATSCAATDNWPASRDHRAGGAGRIRHRSR